jgi:hypothetical protein
VGNCRVERIAVEHIIVISNWKEFSMLSRNVQLFLAAVLTVYIVGCDNPTNPGGEGLHEDAQGLVLKSEDSVIVRVDSGMVRFGTISVDLGVSDHIGVWFLGEDGEEFRPTRSEFSLGWEVADTTIAILFQDSHTGKWEFHVDGRGVGSTTVVMKLLHSGHGDFLTPPINLFVQ